MKLFKLLALTAAPAAIAIAALVSIGSATLNAKPYGYKVPDETATFKPGTNMDVAANNCTACHSADYVQNQPRGASFKKNFWQAEVTKMIKVYGAPIEDADASKIVDYLTENY